MQRKAACACGGACPRCRDDAPFQAKLAVSQPGDAFEHEADRIAAEVMGTSDAPPAVTPAAQPQSRRSPSGASPAATPVPESVHEVVRSAGEPLDADTRAFMEVRLGAEFGDVRVHADASAAESAEAVGALAWTVGQHIAFAPGRYAPGSAAGRALLAHELVHVTQQRSAAPRVQRQTAAEADLTVLRAALLEHIRNAIAFTDDEQVRARLTTLRDQAATMTAAQLRAAIPGVQQLAAAGQTAMTSTRAAIQPRAQPSTLDPLVDDADAVIRESRGYQLHQMIQMVTASTSFGARNIRQMLRDMNTSLTAIDWFAQSDVGFGAATSLISVSGTPATAHIEVTLGPSMLMLMNRPDEDMIPTLFHELYHAWEQFRQQARGGLPARANLAEAEMARQGALLPGSPAAADMPFVGDATGFARALESELFARLVEHSALQDPSFAGRSPRTVGTASGVITVNEPARAASVVRQSLQQMRTVFGLVTARTIAQQLLARANSEAIIHPNTRQMFRDMIADELP